MPLEANIIWNNTIVGTVTDIVNDMWYIEGKWNRVETDYTETFERITRELDAREIFKDPFKGLMASITYIESAATLQPVLIFSLDDTTILMRIIVNEELVRQLETINRKREMDAAKLEKRSSKKMWWQFWK